MATYNPYGFTLFQLKADRVHAYQAHDNVRSYAPGRRYSFFPEIEYCYVVEQNACNDYVAQSIYVPWTEASAQRGLDFGFKEIDWLGSESLKEELLIAAGEVRETGKTNSKLVRNIPVLVTF